MCIGTVYLILNVSPFLDTVADTIHVNTLDNDISVIEMENANKKRLKSNKSAEYVGIISGILLYNVDIIAVIFCKLLNIILNSG